MIRFKMLQVSLKLIDPVQNWLIRFNVGRNELMLLKILIELTRNLLKQINIINHDINIM